eukprot:m.148531 g.148531  ORF g.148531 m.148531 type:complete len:699 (-) comp17318_c1_seq2:181-2277(-)
MAAGDSGKAQALAVRAQELFESGKYGECTATLVLLNKERAQDSKVEHNLAVARFYQGGQALFKPLEVAFAKAVALNEKKTQEGFDDESDMAVLALNQAVMLYQDRELQKARAVLEKAFKFIDAADEAIAQRVCFLLLDLYLQAYLPDQAMVVLTCLEKMLGNASASSGGAANGQGGEDEAKPASSEGGDGQPQEEANLLRFYIHQYKARVHMISRSMKACKREIKSALNLSSQNPPALFLKASLEYIRHNYRKSVKLLLGCPKLAPYVSGQCAAVLYYNNLGCIHLQMKKYSVASFYFGKALQANEQSAGRDSSAAPEEQRPYTAIADRRHELMYNQGLVFLLSGQPVLAHKCFQIALEVAARNPRLWVRLAECCIMHEAQSRSEQSASHNDRVACTVGRAQARTVLLRPPTNAGPLPSSDTTGLGLFTACGYLKNALHLLQQNVEKPAVAGMGGLSGGSATSLGGAATAAAAATATATPSGSTTFPGTESSPIRESEVPALRCETLVRLAYACLGCHNPVDALKHATALLEDQDPPCPSRAKYLGHLYAAEALCLLGREAEALRYLSPDILADINTPSESAANLQAGDGEVAQTQPNNQNAESASGTCKPLQSFAFDQPSAKLALLINLASVCCVTNDLPRASSCLQEANRLVDGSTEQSLVLHLVLLSTYLSLRDGRVQDAIDIAKHHRLATAPAS